MISIDFFFFAHRGAPPPGPPTLGPGVHILPILKILYGAVGSIYYPYRKHYEDCTVHIIGQHTREYGLYGP